MSNLLKEFIIDVISQTTLIFNDSKILLIKLPYKSYQVISLIRHALDNPNSIFGYTYQANAIMEMSKQIEFDKHDILDAICHYIHKACDEKKNFDEISSEIKILNDTCKYHTIEQFSSMQEKYKQYLSNNFDENMLQFLLTSIKNKSITWSIC